MVTVDAIRKSYKKGLTFIYPPLPPREHGISGGYGHSYDINTIKYIGQLIKNMIRFILFQLKIFPLNKK